MASLNKIEVGQTLYDYHKYRQGNTTCYAMGWWPVRVIEIDLDNRTVLCSWNGNRAQWWSERRFKKLRVHKKKA